MKSPEDSFAKIIQLSESMLENARQANWEYVTRIEAERRELLSLFFANPIQIQKDEVATGIRAILKADREIVKLGANRREELRVALKKINRGKSAVQAYSAVG